MRFRLALALVVVTVHPVGGLFAQDSAPSSHVVSPVTGAEPAPGTPELGQSDQSARTEAEMIGDLLAQSLGDVAAPGDTEVSGEAEGEAERDEAATSREEAIAALEALRAHIGEGMTTGYQGELISEEKIGGELLRKHMKVWFRLRPRSVRLEFISPDEGQVIVWQQGWEKMIVDRPWLPALRIDPAGERALASGHRPVTTFGIDLTIDRYLQALRRAVPDGEFHVDHIGQEQVGRQTLDRWDFLHPHVGGSPVTSFSIWLDPGTGLPIHFENRSADGSVYERYRYLRFEVNPPLGDDLFED